MKNKILYILTIIICIGASSGITFLMVENKFNDVKLNEEKTVKTVSITEENSIKESVGKIYDATVLVETYYDSRKLGSGTGFVYKTDDKYGYILTNHHVVEDSNDIQVTNNAGQVVTATLLGSDEVSDVAILRIDKDAVMQVAEIGSSSDLEIGDSLFTVGSPLGSKYMGTVTRGILSGKDRLVSVSLSSGQYRMEVLQTDAAINPGNSGGPLVNINGEVVGIISLKLVQDEIEGMGFAIPIEIALALEPALEKGEKIERPAIGIELVDVSSTYNLYLHKIYLDSKVSYGAVITSVSDDYQSARDNLKKGDVIIELDGNKIEDSSHLRYFLYKYKVGDKIKLKVIRDNKEVEVEIVLSSTIQNN